MQIQDVSKTPCFCLTSVSSGTEVCRSVLRADRTPYKKMAVLSAHAHACSTNARRRSSSLSCPCAEEKFLRTSHGNVQQATLFSQVCIGPRNDAVIDAGDDRCPNRQPFGTHHSHNANAVTLRECSIFP